MPPKADENTAQKLEEQNRLMREQNRLSEEQKRLAEEQLKTSKRAADEEWVTRELAKQRDKLRQMNQKAKEDAAGLGINPATLPLLDEQTVIDQFEKELRKAKGLD